MRNSTLPPIKKAAKASEKLDYRQVVHDRREETLKNLSRANGLTKTRTTAKGKSSTE